MSDVVSPSGPVAQRQSRGLISDLSHLPKIAEFSGKRPQRHSRQPFQKIQELPCFLWRATNSVPGSVPSSMHVSVRKEKLDVDLQFFENVPPHTGSGDKEVR